MTEENWASQGARLTVEAIKTTTRYLPTRHYEIKLIPVDRRNNPVITRQFTRAELLKSVRFLRGKNAEGYHIYFRPDAQHFVFVDDVCDDDIQSMIKDDIRPVLVYETSEGLHHAWVQLANRPEQVAKDEARQARVILAEQYSGDKNATGRNQPGRLPGFRNVKPMYEDRNGGHPLVTIKRSCFAPVASTLLRKAKERIGSSPKTSPLSPGGGVNTDLSNSTPDNHLIEIYDHGRHIVTMSAIYEIGDMQNAYDRVLEDMKRNGYVPPIRNSGTGIDRSRQDIAIVRYLLRRCVSERTTIEVLLHGSQKTEERGRNYVLQTVGSVYK